MSTSVLASLPSLYFIERKLLEKQPFSLEMSGGRLKTSNEVGNPERNAEILLDMAGTVLGETDLRQAHLLTRMILKKISMLAYRMGNAYEGLQKRAIAVRLGGKG